MLRAVCEGVAPPKPVPEASHEVPPRHHVPWVPFRVVVPALKELLQELEVA